MPFRWSRSGVQGEWSTITRPRRSRRGEAGAGRKASGAQSPAQGEVGEVKHERGARRVDHNHPPKHEVLWHTTGMTWDPRIGCRHTG
eukprot:342724-Pelagomonas_calceolata.AAC.2